MHTSLHLVRLIGPSSDVEWTPNTDIYENESSFVVRMELAGVGRESLQISFSDRTLIVRGWRPDPGRTKHCHFRQMEINYGTFERRLAIPRGVDGQKIRAGCRNGFLTIELPKRLRSVPTPVRVSIAEED